MKSTLHELLLLEKDLHGGLIGVLASQHRSLHSRLTELLTGIRIAEQHQQRLAACSTLPQQSNDYVPASCHGCGLGSRSAASTCDTDDVCSRSGALEDQSSASEPPCERHEPPPPCRGLRASPAAVHRPRAGERSAAPPPTARRAGTRLRCARPSSEQRAPWSALASPPARQSPSRSPTRSPRAGPLALRFQSRSPTRSLAGAPHGAVVMRLLSTPVAATHPPVMLKPRSTLGACRGASPSPLDTASSCQPLCSRASLLSPAELSDSRMARLRLLGA